MHKRKILIFVTLFIMFFNCFSINAFAAEEKYSIDSVDFKIELNNDGSATVTESWTITYKEGVFSRFYKTIYLMLPDDEKFEIEFKEVFVDGRQCVYTGNKSFDTDYTYATIENENRILYEIYAHSENRTRNYVITYILHDVIKNVDDDGYVFKYRLLPNGFKKTIPEMNVSISLSGYSYNTVSIEPSKGAVTFEDSDITICAKDVSDLYVLELKLNDFPNNTTAIGTLDILVLSAAIIMFALFILFILYLHDAIHKKQKCKIAEGNMSDNIIENASEDNQNDISEEKK